MLILNIKLYIKKSWLCILWGFSFCLSSIFTNFAFLFWSVYCCWCLTFFFSCIRIRISVIIANGHIERSRKEKKMCAICIVEAVFGVKQPFHLTIIAVAFACSTRDTDTSEVVRCERECILELQIGKNANKERNLADGWPANRHDTHTECLSTVCTVCLTLAVTALHTSLESTIWRIVGLSLVSTLMAHKTGPQFAMDFALHSFWSPQYEQSEHSVHHLHLIRWFFFHSLFPFSFHASNTQCVDLMFNHSFQFTHATALTVNIYATIALRRLQMHRINKL